MKEIRIQDDKGSIPNVPVVKLICDCGWVDKTFQRGSLDFAATHANTYHGGYGRIVYLGDVRVLENGILLV